MYGGWGEPVEALVVGVADALSGQVGAEGPAAELVFLEDAELFLDVAGIGGCPADIHVVAPAGDFQAVITPAAYFLA